MLAIKESFNQGKQATHYSNGLQAVYTRDNHQNGMSFMALQQRPTAMLTLTVKEPRLSHRYDNGRWLIKDANLLRTATKLLHFVNSSIFGKQYKKSGTFLTGFGCIAPQKNHQPHLHLLIDNPMPAEQFLRISFIVKEKIKKLKLFNTTGTDFQVIKDTKEDYLRIGDYIGREGKLVVFDGNGLH